MAIKILATKAYTDTSVNTEATTRATNDSSISSELSTRTTAINNSNVSVTAVVTAVTNETNARTAIAGSGVDYSGLKLPDNTTSVSNMSQAINALYRKQAAIGSAASGASSTEASNLLASANTQAAITDANKNAIDNILLNAHSNFDTFIELFNLTSGNRTSVLNAITALQTSLTATAGSKVNRTQTDSNTLVYLDQQNLTSTFKLVVDNGQLTIVEV
jgi:hypothetical protein